MKKRAVISMLIFFAALFLVWEVVAHSPYPEWALRAATLLSAATAYLSYHKPDKPAHYQFDREFRQAFAFWGFISNLAWFVTLGLAIWWLCGLVHIWLVWKCVLELPLAGWSIFRLWQGFRKL